MATLDDHLPHHPTKGSPVMTEHNPPEPERAGLLARLSNRLNTASQHHPRAKVWIAAGLWLLTGGVVWGGNVAGAVASMDMSAGQANGGGGAAGMDSGGVTRTWVGVGVGALLVLLLVHLFAEIPWASFGMRLRDGRRRIFGGAAGAAVLYVAAMVVAAWVFQALTTSQADGPRGYPGMGTPGARLLAGDITSVTFGGGIWEELTLLAIPVALFTALVPLKAMGRGRRYACWSALVVALLAARWAIHLYYGPVPALHVLVWAVPAVGLFLASGTIWPLILAHSLYDAAAFTAARIPAANAAITELFWAVSAAAVIVLVLTGIRWWNRTRHTRPNLRSSGEGM